MSGFNHQGRGYSDVPTFEDTSMPRALSLEELPGNRWRRAPI